MRSPVVTVVGSFAVGMTLRTTRMPVFGETLLGSDFDMGPGGKGSNQAVAASRLGAQSVFAGIIGDDRLGAVATDLYVQEGVNTAHLVRTKEASTGAGFIILNETGDNAIILDMAANKLMDTSFVDGLEEQFARSDVVMSVLEIPVEAAARTMELGRRHGVPTILNPAPATRLDKDTLRNVDYLTPNETELRILLGLAPDDPSSTEELAGRLREQGAGNLIVTLGERGALIVTDQGSQTTAGVQVEVVDTTGAGDAFNAGLAIGLAEGRALPDAVRFGCCAGALACTRLGVIPALGRRESVERLYADRN